MKSIRFAALAVGGALLFGTVGCAAHHHGRPGCCDERGHRCQKCGGACAHAAWGIPLGEWHGSGTFFYECHRKSAGGAQPGAASGSECDGVPSVARRYPTTLKIARATLDGHEVVEFSILSERGEIPKLDNRSQLRFALEPSEALPIADTCCGTVRLYRMVAAEFNPTATSPDYKYGPNTDAPSRASLMVRGGEVVLQVAYCDNFVDTFRFRGRSLEKSGSFYQDNPGYVQWVEHLRRP